MRAAARQPADRVVRDRARTSDRRRHVPGLERRPRRRGRPRARSAPRQRSSGTRTSALPDVGAVVLPGGFSYGDYLRCGAIARFAPVMRAVKAFAEQGGLVLGICNGFQVLCEAGLLPGVLRPNASLSFVCRDVGAGGRASGHALHIPVPGRPAAHDPRQARRGLLHPAPRRSRRDRSCSATQPARTRTAPSTTSPASSRKPGNVMGLMPHPEHAVDPAARLDRRRARARLARRRCARHIPQAPPLSSGRVAQRRP